MKNFFILISSIMVVLGMVSTASLAIAQDGMPMHQGNGMMGMNCPMMGMGGIWPAVTLTLFTALIIALIALSVFLVRRSRRYQ